jgi:hypothetical protein
MDTDAVDNLNVPADLTEAPDQDHTHPDGVPFVERFPSGLAGAPISNVGQSLPGFQSLQDGLGAENVWAPFQSQRDWVFAQWAKNRGPGSTAVTELLAIDGVSS